MRRVGLPIEKPIIEPKKAEEKKPTKKKEGAEDVGNK